VRPSPTGTTPRGVHGKLWIIAVACILVVSGCLISALPTASRLHFALTPWKPDFRQGVGCFGLAHRMSAL
jgi:hypothetical protein